jgi:hypothetical protein
MALFRVNATRGGTLRLAGRAGDWRPALEAALAGVPQAAPVCILVHGFRFTWRPEMGAGSHCPHSRLYLEEAAAPERRLRPARAAWPAALGFAEAGPDDGLCICLGWDARLSRSGVSLMRSRGFAEVYRGAGVAGQALATLVAAVAEARPGRPVDVLAHSLGARVALTATAIAPNLPYGRLVLLGAAEYAGEARRAVRILDRAGSGAAVYHVLSRANDLFDALFQFLAPPPARAGDRPLGAAGLGRGHPRWLDLQLDHPEMRDWLARRGHGLTRPVERLSHWHFYADPGAMRLYRAILRERSAHAIPALRGAGVPEALEPRWCRLGLHVPALPGLRPASGEPVADLTEV